MRIDDLSAGDWRLKEFLPSGWVRPDLVDAALSDDGGWIAAAVPGSVHRAVVAAGLAPDPYAGRGSVAGEWIADRTWVFHTRFVVDPAPTGARRILRIGGIDYEARFVLAALGAKTEPAASTDAAGTQTKTETKRR